MKVPVRMMPSVGALPPALCPVHGMQAWTAAATGHLENVLFTASVLKASSVTQCNALMGNQSAAGSSASRISWTYMVSEQNVAL